MTYTLPHPLRRHIREDILGSRFFSTHWLNLTCNVRCLTSLKAFIFWMSGAEGEPFEQISRREISFYDADGHEVGFCLQEACYTTSWLLGANREEGGETVAEALARLDDSAAVAFVLVTFYSHQEIKKVTVWRLV